MDLGKNHFLYDPDCKDLRFFEHTDKWTVTGVEAAEYIRNHVITSLEGDVPPILDLFEKGTKHEGKGFFAMLRVIFPYLTWAGKLFHSSGSEAEKASAFLNYYTGQRYKKYGKYLYDIYRHGLMHNHFPNVMVDKSARVVLGWAITINTSEHLRVRSDRITCRDTRRRLRVDIIPICPRQLYWDVDGALHVYARDLQEGKRLKEFRRGFLSKTK